MPGDSKKWLEIIAHHEGGHLDNIKRVETPTGILADETKSDRVAIKEMSTSNPETDMGLAWKDLRALTDTNMDTIHGTSALLGSNDAVSSLHFKIAGSYQNDMMRNVFDNFDFDTYEGEAEASYGLLMEDPEAFFKVVNDSIEQTKQEAMEAYNADPTSKEAIKAVVGVQIHTDYVNSSEGAFMRRVKGQLDFPEAPPTQLIPQEVEDQFYADLKHENNINFLEQEHTFNSYDEHFPDRKINWPTLEDGMQIRPEYLKSEDPERYFNLQREYLDNLKAKTYEQAVSNPTTENLGKAISAQHAYIRYGEFYNEDLQIRKGLLIEEIKNEKEFLEEIPQLREELRSELLFYAEEDGTEMTEEEVEKALDKDFEDVYGIDRENYWQEFQGKYDKLQELETIDVTPYITDETKEYYYDVRLKQIEQEKALEQENPQDTEAGPQAPAFGPGPESTKYIDPPFLPSAGSVIPPYLEGFRSRTF